MFAAMSHAHALEIRIADRKLDMISEIIELKKGSRVDAAETIDRLKARLSELGEIVKESGGVGRGVHTRRRLDQWLAR